MFFIFNFASSISNSVIFTEFMPSSSSFCRVYDKFKQFLSPLGYVQNLINFFRDLGQVRVRDFCFTSSAKKNEFSEFDFADLD